MLAFRAHERCGSERVEGLSSRVEVLVTVHHAHPDLCPTLRRVDITLSAVIQAEYQLQVQHIKLHAVP